MSWRLSESKKSPGWFALIGPYDQEFMADWKRVVPTHGREWRPVAKLWRIHEDYVAAVERVIEAHSHR